jgi:curli biogenesis system outer membrane secretion channel CsgG
MTMRHALVLALACLLAAAPALAATSSGPAPATDAAAARARQATRCSMAYGIAAMAVTDAQQKQDLQDLHDLMLALAADDGATRPQMEAWLAEFSAEVDPDPKPALVSEAKACGQFFVEQKARVAKLMGEDGASAK